MLMQFKYLNTSDLHTYWDGMHTVDFLYTLVGKYTVLCASWLCTWYCFHRISLDMHFGNCLFGRPPDLHSPHAFHILMQRSLNDKLQHAGF